MSDVSRDQLLQWRATLEKEISGTEAQVNPLMAKLASLKGKLKAIDLLIGSPTEIGGGSGSRPGSNKAAHPVLVPESKVAREFTPVEAYWIPILESAAELGGRAHSEDVLERVEKKMAGILTAEDYDLLPSGISVRWKNRAQWQRKNMVDQGLMRKDSPRGIWEITPEGEKWLDQKKKRHA